MATLLTKTIALEIAYIRAEANSTACDFRITWNGHDFISKEAVNHQESGQVQGGVSFRACDRDDNCLCKAIRQELSASEPVYWTAAHGSVGVAMFPCDAPPWLLFQWITPGDGNG